ncbi:geranylgeranylglyceryl/heptaprenylglyceryl phosphate synthase [Halobacteriales archaeon Cl-PHB]
MSGLGSIVRTLDTVGSVVSIGGRTLLGIDTNPVPDDWAHVTKVDPENEKKLPLAYPLYLQHTGGVSVGGSRDVTERNTEETFELCNAADVTAFHEPSAASHVTDRTRDQAAFLAIPEVLNGDSESLVGTLGEGIEHVKEEVAPALLEEKLPLPVTGSLGDKLADFAASWMIHEAVFEAYIIQNLDSAAAREANVTEENLLTPTEAKRRAMAAERHLGSEIIYLEYSGTYGGEEAVDILEAIDAGITGSRVWYGGGLDDRDNARAVAEAGADAVVVGDVFHDVADEEADLVEQALDDLGTDAEREEVRAWVEDEVDLPETSAARYLSTILSVPDPEQRAARYLADGVAVALQFHAIAEDLDDPTERDLRRAFAGESVPGETVFADALGDDARDMASRLGVSLLADRFDVTLDDGFACRHLAIDL